MLSEKLRGETQKTLTAEDLQGLDHSEANQPPGNAILEQTSPWLT